MGKDMTAPDEREVRLDKLSRELERNECDAAFITRSIHLHYYLNVKPSILEGGALFYRPGGRSAFFTSMTEVDDLPPGIEVVQYPGYRIDELFDPAIDRLKAVKPEAGNLIKGVRRLGIEAGYCPQDLAGLFGTDKGDITSIIREQRMVKSASEIARIRRAIEVWTEGQKRAREATFPGATEVDIGLAARVGMERTAGTWIKVKGDILSGPRSGLISGPPTDRIVRAGEPVIIDLLPEVDWYWGDGTRMVMLSPVEREAEDVLKILIAAKKNVRDNLKPGMTAQTINELAREVVEEHDYGDNFPHHTGHGIGLESLEWPFLVPWNDRQLIQPGMVLAVEPGVYFENRWGLRTEDILLVKEDGVELLTELPG